MPKSAEFDALVANEFADYRLRVGGLVERPVELSFAELKAMPKQEQITIHFCIQGWSGVAKWGGVPMRDILDLVRPTAEARYAVLYSFADGGDGGRYYDTHSLANMRHELTILAYEMNGAPVSVLHGAPLRLRCENEVGFKRVKLDRGDRARERLMRPRCGRGAATTRIMNSSVTGCRSDLLFRRCRLGASLSPHTSSRRSPMLRSMKDLAGLAVEATDGAIGHVKDFYFDDSAWVVRYLVVETGSWLSSRKVLISPISMGHPDWAGKTLPVSITKEQVKNSPGIDTEKPVSRQHEAQYLGYYGYPPYWGGGGLWGGGLYPNLILPGYAGFGSTEAARSEAENAYARAEAAQERQHAHDDPHLRSCQAVMSYHIHATDGDIGHVQGFLIDDETWAIRYVIANTSNWWLGHEVPIARERIKEVSWSDASITVDVTRQAVRDAPLHDPSTPLDRERVRGLHEHYERPLYWTEVPKRETDISRE